MVMNRAVGPDGGESATATAYIQGEGGKGVSQVLEPNEGDQWTGSITIVHEDEGGSRESLE
jgi:hypothetical protein